MQCIEKYEENPEGCNWRHQNVPERDPLDYIPKRTPEEIAIAKRRANQERINKSCPRCNHPYLLRSLNPISIRDTRYECEKCGKFS